MQAGLLVLPESQYTDNTRDNTKVEGKLNQGRWAGLFCEQG